MAKLQPLMARIERGRRRREGRGGVHRVPRRAAAGQQGEEDRHAGLLHGRPAGRQDRRGGARPRRRRRVVPRRRPRHRPARQPAPARAQDQGADVLRRRVERRRAAARREGQAEGSVRRREGAGGGRGLSARSTAGACRTCRRRPASRSTTSPTPSAPGASWSRCTRRRWPDGRAA